MLLILLGVSLYISKNTDIFTHWSNELEKAIDRSWKNYLKRRAKEDEYNESKLPREFMIWRNFTARTLLNFKVEYELRLLTRPTDVGEFKNHRMLERASRQALAKEVNEECFLPYLEQNHYRFSFNFPTSIASDEIHKAFRPMLYRLEKEEDGRISLRRWADGKFKVDLHNLAFKKNGCEIRIGVDLPWNVPDSLIEENYAMLNEEQRTALSNNERFAEMEEMVAVAALQRRLDFLGRGSLQKHQSDAFQVEVERAGAGVRIKWWFVFRHELGTHELLGFRKTGGFFSDPWDEQNNGILVIHDDRDNEVIEFPKEGETYFYTLFSQWPKGDGTMEKSGAVRFQVTIAPEKETMAIETALRRITERKPVADPAKEAVSQALKELGAYFEMEKAFEAMEKSFAEEIEKSDRSPEEKEQKVERLRDIVAQIRSKYEP